MASTAGEEPSDEPVRKRAKADHFCEHFADPDVDNLRIREIRAVVSPQLLLAELPMTLEGKATVLRGRTEAKSIIQGEDDRLLVITGPCSIHDPPAALEYARRLKAEKCRFAADLCLVMRVYFEKPQTTAGWKGLVNDPAMDQSYMVVTGLRMSRKLLQEINHIGIPCATEFLDTNAPQYLADLVSWACIGTHTAESQLHRQMASGLSMPVGFENPVSGDIDAALDACLSATQPHCFFGNTKQGTTAIVHSLGNEDVHIVLCGSKQGPNCAEARVQEALAKIESRGLARALLVDCAGNAGDFRQQPKVAELVAQQVAQVGCGVAGVIRGVMLKSNLVAGSQVIPQPAGEPDFGHRGKAVLVGVGTGGDVGEGLRKRLRYGVSVTDACIDWPTTVEVLEHLAAAVRESRKARSNATSHARNNISTPHSTA